MRMLLALVCSWLLAPMQAAWAEDPEPIRLDGATVVWPSMPDTSGSLVSLSPVQTLTGRSIVGLDVTPTFRWTRPGGFFGLHFGGTHEVDADPTALNFMSALHVDYTSTSSTDGVAPWFPDMIVERWTARMDGRDKAATTGLIPIAFGALPGVAATNGATLAVLDRCAYSCGLGTNKPCRKATEATDCAGCATGVENSCTDRGGLITVYAHPTLRADEGSRLSLVRRAVVFDRGARFDATGSGTVTLETDNTVYIADRSGAETTRAIESQLTAGSGKFFLYAQGDAPSVHAGRLRIGTPAAPGAALDLGDGRDKHLRMAGAPEDPEVPRPGDVWYNTRQQAHRTHTGVGTLGEVGVLATITSDSDAIGPAADETPFSNGAVMLPENSVGPGKTIRIRAGGRYSSPRAAGLRLTVRWGANTTGRDNLLVDTGEVAVTPGVVDGGWTMDTDITVRSTGVEGTAAARGVATFGGVRSPAIVATDVRAGATTIDTTVATPLTMLATWGGAAAGGAITLEVATFEILD